MAPTDKTVEQLYEMVLDLGNKLNAFALKSKFRTLKKKVANLDDKLYHKLMDFIFRAHKEIYDEIDKLFVDLPFTLTFVEQRSFREKRFEFLHKHFMRDHEAFYQLIYLPDDKWCEVERWVENNDRLKTLTKMIRSLEELNVANK